MTITESVLNQQKKTPLARVKVFRQWKDLLFLSGHGCEDNFTSKPLATGKLGAGITVSEGRKLAKACALILLDALQDALGSLDDVQNILYAFALIQCTEDFSAHNEVMDGFSDTMVAVLGDRGMHTRMVAGTCALPYGIPIEIEIVVQVRERA